MKEMFVKIGRVRHGVKIVLVQHSFVSEVGKQATELPSQKKEDSTLRKSQPEELLREELVIEKF